MMTSVPTEKGEAMITLNLRDPRLAEHAKMALYLRDSGLFTDEEIQAMYDKQIEKDAKEDGK